MTLILGILEQTAGGAAPGAYPVIASNTYVQDSTSTAPIQFQYPPTVDANDLLILLLNRVNGLGAPDATPSGWTRLSTGAPSSAAGSHSVFYKRASGTEDGTFTTFSTSLSCTVLATMLRITSAHATTNPEALLARMGDPTFTASFDPPALDPSWATANNLIIAVAMSQQDRTISAYPAGYALYNQNNITADGNTAVAAKEVAVSTSEDPGPFTLSSSAEGWAVIIAVRGL